MKQLRQQQMIDQLAAMLSGAPTLAALAQYIVEKDIDPLAPGIYFNLSDERYHGDPALSRSNMVDLLDTPNSYWKNSWLNGARKRKKASDPMKFGSAFDCLMFEPKVFNDRYQITPIDAWEQHKIKIALEDYNKIIDSIKVLKKGRDSSLFLSAGISQVTIVFDYMGYRFRVRIDWFTPVLSTDFKTANSLAVHHLKWAFSQYGYDIQLWLYRLARSRFKEQFLAGEAEVYGQVDPAFFTKFMEDTNNGFVFIFQRSSEPYPYEPLWPEDDTEENGQMRAEKAVLTYTQYLKSHGTVEWPVCDGKIKRFSMHYGLTQG
jgi:hypothetical protein